MYWPGLIILFSFPYLAIITNDDFHCGHLTLTHTHTQATLNPFYTPNTPITSNSFKKKANALARKYLA